MNEQGPSKPKASKIIVQKKKPSPPYPNKNHRLEQDGGWSSRWESTILPGCGTLINFHFSQAPVPQVWLLLQQTAKPTFLFTVF